MKQITLSLLTLLVTLFNLSCSDNIAGGASEAEAGTVSGIIIVKNGNIAPNTTINIYSTNNKENAGQSTTDEDGRFSFHSLQPGRYFLYGVKDSLKFGEFLNLSNDTIDLVDTLTAPGTVQIRILEDSLPIDAICRIKDTPFEKSIDEGKSTSDGYKIFSFESAPAILYPAVVIESQNAVTGNFYYIPVLSGDTTEVGFSTKWSSVSLPPPFTSLKVNDITFNLSGILFGATDEGLLYIDDTNTNINTTLGINNLIVNTIAPGTGDTIWGGGNNGLFRYINNTTDVYDTTNSLLPGNKIIDVASGLDSSVWIATDSGIVNWKNGFQNMFNTSNSELPSLNITSFSVDTSGTLWVATSDKGIFSLTASGTIITYSFENSLIPTQEIDLIISSYEGLWMLTSLGVLKFDGETWTLMTVGNTPLKSLSINNIAVNRVLREIWFVMDQKIIRKNGTTWITEDLTSVAASGEVTHVGFSNDGSFGALSGVGRIFRFDLR